MATHRWGSIEDFVAPATVDFMRAHPGLSVELDFSNRLIDLMSDGYDLAIRAGTLVTVLGDYNPTDTGVWAVYPHNRHLTAKVRLFVNFLAERFQQALPIQSSALCYPLSVRHHSGTQTSGTATS